MEWFGDSLTAVLLLQAAVMRVVGNLTRIGNENVEHITFVGLRRLSEVSLTAGGYFPM
jgi:hypothetical protein